jgi:hypothetical protein
MIVKVVVLVIKFYQKISSLFPRVCRFYPTCSEYMISALEKYGIIKGALLGIKRLLKCHPLHPGGYDPLK